MHWTHLYRHFDSRGRLLYVGIARNALHRLGNHFRARWYREIRTVTIEPFRSRGTAMKAEKQAIASEKPLFQLNGHAWDGDPIEKTCPHCHKAWSSPDPYKKLCQDCDQIPPRLRYKATIARWEERNRAKIRLFQRDYQRQRRAKQKLEAL